MRPSNSSRNEYLLMGILTLTCFLFDVKVLLDAKPKLSASTAVVAVSRYQKEFLATLLE